VIKDLKGRRLEEKEKELRYRSHLDGRISGEISLRFSKRGGVEKGRRASSKERNLSPRRETKG